MTHDSRGEIAMDVAVVQLLGRVWLFAVPWTAAHQASLSFTVSWSLLKLMSIESVTPSNCISSPPAFNQGLSQRAGPSHQVAKVLELQHQSF